METDTRAHTGSASVVDPVTGHLLDGRYRIGRRIARGGMASVYEALDTRLDRTCAVKIMHHGLGDDDAFAERFKREARAVARLSHPNVVNVFDQGDDPELDGGTLYLVMELVAGHTLRDVIRDDAPMQPVRALALMEPIVSALAAAHRSGLVHRDIKPENVLIADADSGGRVKVADFGLAKAVSADTQHTATGGVIIGTVSYLAPELVVDGTSDARADVYAAGVVLYELLTGEKPHAGESPIAVAYKHVHEDVPPPSRLAPGIPAYVDALVARATAARRRPASGRRGRAPPPAPPRLPGAGERGPGRRGAHHRPGPARGPAEHAGAGHRRHQRLRDPADRPGDPAPGRGGPTGSGLRAPGTRGAAARAAGRDPPGCDAAAALPPRAAHPGGRPRDRGGRRLRCVLVRLGPLHRDARRDRADPEGRHRQARPRRTRREGRRPGVLRGRAEGSRGRAPTPGRVPASSTTAASP